MNFNTVLNWLAVQWNLIGIYFSFPAKPVPPTLLYILGILALMGVFSLNQPIPSIIVVFWFAMIGLSVATKKKEKPPENGE